MKHVFAFQIGLALLGCALCSILLLPVRGVFSPAQQASSPTGSDLAAAVTSLPVTHDGGTPCPYENPLQALSRKDLPAPQKIPSYAGRRDVHIAMTDDPLANPLPSAPPFTLLGGFVRTITTFTTGDSVAEVERFYAGALTLDNWKQGDEGSPDDRMWSWVATSEMFSRLPCPPARPCCMSVPLVRIIVTQQGGVTQVEIVEGYLMGV